MAWERSLSAGHTKFVLLTTRPADPKNPTLAELKAGIDASCRVKGSNFKWGPTDSEKVDSDVLCEDVKSQAWGQSNYQMEFTVYRYFNKGDKTQVENGPAGQTADAVFQLVKVKGTTLYAYIRKSDKKSKDDFAAGDELFYEEFSIDHPQPADGDGYIAYDIKGLVAAAEPLAKVAA